MDKTMMKQLQIELERLVRVNEYESTSPELREANEKRIKELELTITLSHPVKQYDQNNGYYEYVAIQSQAKPNKLTRME
ncbi:MULTISPECIES: hypothetical protein [unclassified Bacillus cereus group]|uniref:hypothetical protein n=1 Tax=unclassified Bacillus cereus group TaxID=2750818 RepID=UPI0022E25019|nr:MULTISPECIES: hypothetical protein [unclassified Bacillus cereus group]MDA1642427.1 hypothetical protein [Bacillus cereus group sp. TH177-1LC]MDA1802938.1 hypothetical protein [Bacillus cereus group sp. BY6-1LC]